MKDVQQYNMPLVVSRVGDAERAAIAGPVGNNISAPVCSSQLDVLLGCFC